MWYRKGGRKEGRTAFSLACLEVNFTITPFASSPLSSLLDICHAPCMRMRVTTSFPRSFSQVLCVYRPRKLSDEFSNFVTAARPPGKGHCHCAALHFTGHDEGVSDCASKSPGGKKTAADLSSSPSLFSGRSVGRVRYLIAVVEMEEVS